jgi:protocatechuate 3,4-dioxygenase beta subunit
MRAFVCLVALTCSSVPALAQASGPLAAAQVRPNQLAPDPTRPARDNVVHTGTAVIRGRVAEAASNQPVRRVRVHAESTALRDGRTAYTDADGRYELKALPAGHYTVTAFKPTYVAAAYGQPRPLELGTSIDVSDAQTIDHIDLGLVRAGVIAGKITDEFGEPLADTQVTAMRYQFAQGTRRLVPAGARMTNDIGEFRLFGIPPGQYYLTATLLNDQEADAASHETYASTYYPGTGSLSGAQPITIAAGQTMAGMNMMVLPVRSVRISGSVTDSSGTPLQGGFLNVVVRMGIGPMGANYGAAVKPDGTFSIAGVAPGDYVLHLGSNNNADKGERADMLLTVGTSDITDLHIVTARPSSVTGRVIVDPTELGALKGSMFRLTTPAANADEAAINGGGAGTPVKDDFTFELSVRPGHVFIRSNTTSWFLRAVRVNGVDVKDSGVEIRANEPLAGVEVELTHRQPDITGTVKTAEGVLTRNAFVVIFPQDRQHWGYLSRYVRMSRPNTDSQFRVQVPPGEYLAIAVEFVEQGEWSDPDFLARVRERAVPFTLAEGEHKTLALTLVALSRN